MELFQASMNKVQAKKLEEIAKILYSKGLIEKPNNYSVTKYALKKLLEAYDVIVTGLIIPLEPITQRGVPNGRREKGEKKKSKK